MRRDAGWTLLPIALYCLSAVAQQPSAPTTPAQAPQLTGPGPPSGRRQGPGHTFCASCGTRASNPLLPITSKDTRANGGWNSFDSDSIRDLNPDLFQEVPGD